MRIRAISIVVFYLAWVIQAFAPVTAAWAMAHATDPFDHLVICSTLQPGQADDGGNNAPPAGQHDDCCLVCQTAAVSSPAPALTLIVLATPEPEPTDALWRPYSPRAPPSPARFHAPPRGPPTLL
jgi:hypothetical protein